MNVRKLSIQIAIVAFLALGVATAAVLFTTLRAGSGDGEQARVGEQVSNRQEQGQNPAPEQTGMDDDVAEAQNERDRAEIGRDEAEEAARNEVPGEVVDTGLDDENGRVVYSVEILGDDGNLHEIEVDASNGDILAHGTEDQDDAAEARSLSERAGISRDEAEEAALGEVPGEILETGLDDENGYAVYGFEILGDDGNLHEVAVDASNGDILGRETENRDGTEYQNGFDD